MKTSERKRAYNAAYAIAHREQIAAAARARYAKDHDRRIERDREYRGSHREQRHAVDNARYAKDHDRLAEKHREYMQTDKNASYRKAYQASHRDSIRAYNREYQRMWRDKNREAFQRAQSEWYRTHQDEIKAYQAAHVDDIRAVKTLRRARKHSAQAEPFVESDIFERDQWACGLCREPVDPTLKHPSPMRKSIDHIIPLARGGAHQADNVQLAHLRCNIRKGALAAVGA